MSSVCFLAAGSISTSDLRHFRSYFKAGRPDSDFSQNTLRHRGCKPAEKETLFQHSNLGSASESGFTPSLPVVINVTGATPLGVREWTDTHRVKPRRIRP